MLRSDRDKHTTCALTISPGRKLVKILTLSFSVARTSCTLHCNDGLSIHGSGTVGQKEGSLPHLMIPWNSSPSAQTLSPTTSMATVACRGFIRVTRARTMASTSGRIVVERVVPAESAPLIAGRETESIGSLLVVLLLVAPRVWLGTVVRLPDIEAQSCDS